MQEEMHRSARGFCILTRSTLSVNHHTVHCYLEHVASRQLTEENIEIEFIKCACLNCVLVFLSER